jgi:hypothetical protein
VGIDSFQLFACDLCQPAGEDALECSGGSFAQQPVEALTARVAVQPCPFEVEERAAFLGMCSRSVHVALHHGAVDVVHERCRISHQHAKERF